MEISLGILGIVLGALLTYFIYRSGQRSSGKVDQEKTDREGLILIQNQMSELARRLDDKLGSSQKVMSEQVRNFTESITRMDESLRSVHSSVNASAEKMGSFQDIFKTPKLRGAWGESNLRFLLEQTYPTGQILEQHHFVAGSDAVDFAIRLPNDYLLPIDSNIYRLRRGTRPRGKNSATPDPAHWHQA
jgi:DNA anti-recombination protein RmuC